MFLYVVTMLKPGQILYGEYDLHLKKFDYIFDAIFMASK